MSVSPGALPDRAQSSIYPALGNRGKQHLCSVPISRQGSPLSETAHPLICCSDFYYIVILGGCVAREPVQTHHLGTCAGSMAQHLQPRYVHGETGGLQLSLAWL